METIIAKQIFQFFCHQLPDRSLQYGGEIFPLCFRCSGIYLGIFINHLTILAFGRFSKISPNRKSGLVLIILVVPLAVDGLGNNFNLWNSSNELRMITGLLLGIFISITLISIPNILKKEDVLKSNLLIEDFLFSISLGLASIYFFVNTYSIFTYNFFVNVVLIGWLIVISNILLFIIESSKTKMNNLFKTVILKNK
jgi:uncharacterized membrane protein